MIAALLRFGKISDNLNDISVFSKYRPKQRHAQLSSSVLFLDRREGGRLRARGRTARHGGADHQRAGARTGEIDRASAAETGGARRHDDRSRRGGVRARGADFSARRGDPRRDARGGRRRRRAARRRSVGRHFKARRARAACAGARHAVARLLCHEGEHAQLLSELALHRLDLVLACQPAPHNARSARAEPAPRRLAGRLVRAG